MREPRGTIPRLVLRSAAIACLVVAPALPTLLGGVDPAERTRLGVFTYLWFPGNNWKIGYTGKKLVPPVAPHLGEYDAGDPGVAERQIAWCTRYGIDFLALSWWPNDKRIEKRIVEGVLAARNIRDIRFCILYESQDLGFVAGQGAIPFDEERTANLVSHFDRMADVFFPHPSYLRIGGRPVVVLYLTRTYTEGYEEAIGRVRAHMASRGIEMYLVGDEIFWKVKGPTASEDRFEPVPERIRLFDAITSYNLYEGLFPHHRGYASESGFLRDAARLYTQYRDAAGEAVDFIPQVFPGYNDRVARPEIDRFAIPRAFSPGAREGSLLEEYIDRIALPFLDRDAKTVLVTSWNEWNEGTQIEPSQKAPPTSLDSSPQGDWFTQGYEYSGYGHLYLKILRNRFVAVSGRVRAGPTGGRGVAGATVWAMAGPRVLASARTDSSGHYTLARDNLVPGRYRILAREGWLGRSASREVEVRAGKTTVEADLSFGGD